MEVAAWAGSLGKGEIERHTERASNLEEAEVSSHLLSPYALTAALSKVYSP